MWGKDPLSKADVMERSLHADLYVPMKAIEGKVQNQVTITLLFKLNIEWLLVTFVFKASISSF